MGRFVGILCAVLVHAAFILFGGLLFFSDKNDKGSLQEVELLSQEEEDKKKDPEPEPDKDMETATEEPPDAAEIIRDLERPPNTDVPALEAASLAAIEQALSGQGGSGDFADALSLASGGRVGGTGKAGSLDDKLENAFSLAEIDQKPRAVFQTSPAIPAEMRGKKIEGLVTVIFVVDPSGKVVSPRVEKSSHSAFDKPALDAIKQWKFEPAIKGGQRVNCKMRQPIRFPPS